jgi:tetratricopeptide (TPR) repeat protein
VRHAKGVAVVALTVLLSAARMAASDANAAAEDARTLRMRGYDAAYNLDYPQAVALYDQAIALDPSNPAGYRARAAAAWLHIIYRRGSITVDQYLGAVHRGDVTLPPPPKDEANIFATNSAKALQLAEQRATATPDSPQAQYDLGAAVGVMASYGATVEGKMLASYREAHRAYDAHERVLALDPSRKDAGLIVGTYRYIVSTLSLPMRWMAYLVGFGGDRALAMRMVEEAAKYPSENQTDARVALLLLYNREGRYADAQSMCRTLIGQFPKNRLFVLEAGATALRASQFAEGERLLTEGITKFADEKRPRAFGELGLWYYKRGMARVAQRKLADAKADLDRARSEPALDWVKSRIALETGKLADLENRRNDALAAYRDAIKLGDASQDDDTVAAARPLLKTPYR